MWPRRKTKSSWISFIGLKMRMACSVMTAKGELNIAPTKPFLRRTVALRRAYDRTLTSTQFSQPNRASTFAPGTGGASRWAYEMHERRRRGATHAWEGPRGSRPHQSATHQHSHSHPHTRSRTGAGGHYDSTAGPYAHESGSSTSTSSSSSRTGTTAPGASGTPPRGADAVRNAETPLRGRIARAEEERRAHDKVVQESGVMRFLSMLGVLIVVTFVSGFGGKGAG